MEKGKKTVLVFAAIVGCFFMGLLVSQAMYQPDNRQIQPASDRFEVVMDGQAVLDKQTSLVWAKNADLGGVMTLENAKDYCKNLSIGSRRDWRLPTLEEMVTLLDSFEDNQLASGHPFDKVQFNLYWTSTDEPESDTAFAFHMGLATGILDNYYNKYNKHYVWPVRYAH